MKPEFLIINQFVYRRWISLFAVFDGPILDQFLTGKILRGILGRIFSKKQDFSVEVSGRRC